MFVTRRCFYDLLEELGYTWNLALREYRLGKYGDLGSLHQRVEKLEATVRAILDHLGVDVDTPKVRLVKVKQAEGKP